MILRLFVQPNCPKCPTAKEIVNVLKNRRDDITVEILDLSEINNLTFALMMQIASTPSFAIDDTPIFIGNIPSLDELEKKIDEYIKRQE